MIFFFLTNARRQRVQRKFKEGTLELAMRYQRKSVNSSRRLRCVASIDFQFVDASSYDPSAPRDEGHRTSKKTLLWKNGKKKRVVYLIV
jgi:hypothetical protein